LLRLAQRAGPERVAGRTTCYTNDSPMEMEPTPSDAPPVVFVHIEKAAGSTVHSAIYEALGPDKCFIVSGPPALETLRAMTPVDRQTLRYISGHIRYREAVALFPDARYVTSVRNPVHRVLSHYFYGIRNETVGPHMSLKKFVNSIGHDHQCRSICGEASADAAISRLRDSYAMAADIGQLDRFVEMLLGHLLGRNPDMAGKLKAINVAPVAEHYTQHKQGMRPADYDAFLTKSTRALLCSATEEDRKLHRWIVEECGGFFMAKGFAGRRGDP